MYERRYHDKVLKQDEKKTPRKRVIPWRRYGMIAIGIVVILGFVYVVRLQRFQVRTVEVVGTNVADPQEVSDYVLGQLAGNFIRILPKSSIVLVSPDRLAVHIQAHFPRFKSVMVKRTSMHALSVSVVEYPGVYLWCDNACSFMDEVGTVFADAPLFSGTPYVKLFVGERSPYPFHPIGTDQLSLMKLLIDRLHAITIDAVEFHFTDAHEVRVVYYHNNMKTDIVIDPTRDIEQALEVLYTGIRTEPFASQYRQADKVLQYIDLRFSNKLVYKFQ